MTWHPLTGVNAEDKREALLTLTFQAGMKHVETGLYEAVEGLSLGSGDRTRPDDSSEEEGRTAL